MNLLSPLWVRPDRADALRAHIPKPPIGKGAVVLIAGNYVPDFTGEMYVRRCLGDQQQLKLLGIGGLVGGEDFEAIRDSLCSAVRRQVGGWVNESDSRCIQGEPSRTLDGRPADGAATG